MGFEDLLGAGNSRGRLRHRNRRRSGSAPVPKVMGRRWRWRASKRVAPASPYPTPSLPHVRQPEGGNPWQAAVLFAADGRSTAAVAMARGWSSHLGRPD